MMMWWRKMIPTRLSILPADTDLLNEFSRWVAQHCDATSVVLDVGAGKGKTGYIELIRQKAGWLVGVDPDITIMQNPYLDERHQASVEDFAQRHDPGFDCLYTMYVLEHVTQPHAFLSACCSLLKPGGTLFGITPNLWHYFGMATKLSASLGIEDWLLERLIGAQVRDSYHFPTAYRLNSIRVLRRTLAQSGFREVEFRYIDPPTRFRYCLPKLLHWFPSVYSRLVYTLRLPQVMGLIMFRATTQAKLDFE